MTEFKRPMPHIAGAATGYALNKYKYEDLPLWGYGGFYTIAHASDAADVAIGDLMVSAGAGNPSMMEVTDSGVTGLLIDAAGDLVTLMWPIPYDCDVQSNIDVAVLWSSDQTTTTDTFTWKVLYKELTVDTTAVDIPATALDTAITADTNIGTANALQQTPWGTINGGTLTNGNVLLLHVELDAVSGATLGSDLVYGYYLRVRYVRRAL